LLKNFETSLPKFWQVKTSGGALAPTVAYAENFHGGGFIQSCMVPFVFGRRCL